MSYGSRQEKRQEVTRICIFTVTRRNFSERIQRQKPSDPQIILGRRLMRQAGIQHSDDIMGYPNRLVAAKRGLLVHIKLVVLLSTSMADSLIMASMLLQQGLGSAGLQHCLERRLLVRAWIHVSAEDFRWIFSLPSLLEVNLHGGPLRPPRI